MCLDAGQDNYVLVAAVRDASACTDAGQDVSVYADMGQDISVRADMRQYAFKLLDPPAVNLSVKMLIGTRPILRV